MLAIKKGEHSHLFLHFSEGLFQVKDFKLQRNKLEFEKLGDSKLYKFLRELIDHRNGRNSKRRI